MFLFLCRCPSKTFNKLNCDPRCSARLFHQNSNLICLNWWNRMFRRSWWLPGIHDPWKWKKKSIVSIDTKFSESNKISQWMCMRNCLCYQHNYFLRTYVFVRHLFEEHLLLKCVEILNWIIKKLFLQLCVYNTFQ